MSETQVVAFHNVLEMVEMLPEEEQETLQVEGTWTGKNCPKCQKSKRRVYKR